MLFVLGKRVALGNAPALDQPHKARRMTGIQMHAHIVGVTNGGNVELR
jgi:hypothetical protein